MSTVIRDVLIRTRIERQKAARESGSSGMARAYAETAKAARESTKATNEAVRANREYGKAMQEYVGGANVHWRNAESAANSARKGAAERISNISEGMEGVTRFTRGLALLTTSTEDDMTKLLQKMMKFQAGFDIVAGGTKLVKGLGLAFGVAGAAAGGVTLALGAGAIAVLSYLQRIENLKKQTKEAAENQNKLAESIREVGRAAQERAFGRIDFRSKFGIGDSFRPGSERAAQMEREKRMRDQLDIQTKATAAEYQRAAPQFANNFYEAFGVMMARKTSGKFTEADRGTMESARDFEKRRVYLAEKTLEFSKEVYDRQRRDQQERSEFQQNSLFIGGGLLSSGFGGTGAGAAVAGSAGFGFGAALQQAIANNNATMQRLVDSQTKSLEKMISAYDDAVNRVQRLESELGEANPK